MPSVSIQCPLCAGVLQVDTAWAGQQVACPLCEGLLTLPPAEMLAGFTSNEIAAPPPQMPHEAEGTGPSDDSVTLACPACGGAFQVLLSLAGHHVGCPHCGTATTIPALATVEQSSPPVAFDAYIPVEVTPPPVPTAAPLELEESPRDVRSNRPSDARPPDAPPQTAPLSGSAIQRDEATLHSNDALQPTAHSISEPGLQREPSRVSRPQPVPIDSRRAPLPAAPASSIGFSAVSLRDQERVVGEGSAEIELRRLTPEERARRRFRRNLILSGVCLAILLIVVYALTR
jgi:hypothetical protein